jgi:hypothetical protein
MTDEIIKELWQIKDDIAREHGYDLDRLAADLKSKERPEPASNPVGVTGSARGKARTGAGREDQDKERRP